MNWYKKAQVEKVRPEFWKSVGSWVLVDSDKPKDRNLRPLGKALEKGMGQTIYEFKTIQEAEIFAKEHGWEVVK
jgi:hypothetical protein